MFQIRGAKTGLVDGRLIIPRGDAKELKEGGERRHRSDWKLQSDLLDL